MLPIVFFIISLPDFIGRRDYLNCQRFERCLKIVRLVCHQANKSISEEEIRFFFFDADEQILLSGFPASIFIKLIENIFPL